MTDQTRPLRVAIVGAGPAGIYAADALMKSDTAQDPGVSIDLFERMPAPFGLIRYGVAPDHPRIKGIITALHKVLDKPQVRLLGNLDYGTDFTLEDQNGKTLLKLTHEHFPSREHRDGASGGWPGFLDRIERLVTAR